MVTANIPIQGAEENLVLSLAKQYRVDVSLVRAIYQREFESLKEKSRIKSFVPILCGRRVKAIVTKLYSTKT